MKVLESTLFLSLLLVFILTNYNLINSVLTLILFSLSFCLLLSLKISWVSYFLFLVFVGGMMILFLYITSLSKTTTLKMNLFITMTSLIMLMPLTNCSFLKTKFPLELLFTKPYMFATTFMMFYLLLALIIVIKIIYFNKGPLRKTN